MVMPHPTVFRRPRCAGPLSLVLALALASCHSVESPRERPLHQPSAARTALEPTAEAESGSSLRAAAEDAAPSELDEATRQTRRLARFQREVIELSEPDADFFSENFVSNETSYLQVAKPLHELAQPGGAYIGVGPEQSFSYIALSRPEVAYIVDIRRQNLLLHLLYKTVFVEATSRSHFLTMLLGRPYDRASPPDPNAEVSKVIAHAERQAPDADLFLALHTRFVKLIEQDWGIPLSEEDKKQLSEAHRAFFDDQLDIRFSLDFNNGRSYPTLRSLLRSETPAGERLGFLADEEAFQVVRTMQREHRIIPVVGDFAGDQALPGVAAALTDRGLVVSAFYVSNVEQYLLEPLVWRRWMRNVAALPSDEHSLFVRAYLDQGRRHPQQLDGHRTATVLSTIQGFEQRGESGSFTSFFDISTTALLDVSE